MNKKWKGGHDPRVQVYYSFPNKIFLPILLAIFSASSKPGVILIEIRYNGEKSTSCESDNRERQQSFN